VVVQVPSACHPLLWPARSAAVSVHVLVPEKAPLKVTGIVSVSCGSRYRRTVKPAPIEGTLAIVERCLPLPALTYPLRPSRHRCTDTAYLRGRNTDRSMHRCR